MSLQEATRAGGRSFGDRLMGSDECDYVQFADDTIQGSVHFMVIEGRIARTDVNDSTVRTSRGARIGDTEQRVLELYSGRVTVTPHKYTDGHYLVVAPENGDSTHALIFETDSGRVTTLRGGRQPEVAYTEGCS